jgi:hypothetical protein
MIVGDYTNLIKKLKLLRTLASSDEVSETLYEAITAIKALTTAEFADGFWLVDHEWEAVRSIPEAVEEKQGWIELQPYTLLDHVWVRREWREDYTNIVIRRSPPVNVSPPQLTVATQSVVVEVQSVPKL